MPSSPTVAHASPSTCFPTPGTPSCSGPCATAPGARSNYGSGSGASAPRSSPRLCADCSSTDWSTGRQTLTHHHGSSIDSRLWAGPCWRPSTPSARGPSSTAIRSWPPRKQHARPPRRSRARCPWGQGPDRVGRQDQVVQPVFAQAARDDDSDQGRGARGQGKLREDEGGPAAGGVAWRGAAFAGAPAGAL